MKSDVAAANTAGRFPNISDLERIQDNIQHASARLEAAEKLANNIDAVAKEACDACIEQYPSLNNTDEVNSTETYKAMCLRDIKHYLRLIQYCLVVGGTGPLDEWDIVGGRDDYSTLNLPAPPYVIALSLARSCGYAPCDLSDRALAEYNSLLDYAINALS
jgi:phycoerythrin alpha chain